ncbi:hypothetical protein PMIN06_002389 [Paraphaeosphaeria minitans]
MWDINIMKPKKTTQRRPWLPSFCPRARSPKEPLLRLLKLLQKHLATCYTQLQYTLPSLQPICTAQGCTARLTGPPSHTRNSNGHVSTINDPLCDTHVWQLWSAAVALDALVFNSLRMKICEDGGEDEWEVECGRSFVEGGSPVVKRVSMPREGDGAGWDFCEVDEEEEGQEEEEVLRLSEKGFVMFRGWEGGWWKVCC